MSSPSKVSTAPRPVSRRVRKRAWGIAVGYAAFGTLWIYGSDQALGLMFDDPTQIALWSGYKGLVFVAITAALLLVVMRRAFGNIEKGYLFLKEHEQEIDRLSCLYAVRSQINQAIVRLPNREELFHEVSRVLVDEGKLGMAWVGWNDPETRALVPVAARGDDNGFLRSIRIYTDYRVEGRDLRLGLFAKGVPSSRTTC